MFYPAPFILGNWFHTRTGLAVGIFESTAQIRALAVPEKRFDPKMGATERQAALDGWHRAIRAARV